MCQLQHIVQYKKDMTGLFADCFTGLRKLPGEPHHVEVDQSYPPSTLLLYLYQLNNELHLNNNLKGYKQQVYWSKIMMSTKNQQLCHSWEKEKPGQSKVRIYLDHTIQYKAIIRELFHCMTTDDMFNKLSQTKAFNIVEFFKV